jgi:hypothetical protein
MGKSKIVETVERDGRTIAIYDNGMERDMDRNAIIRPPTSALITKQSTQEMHRKRQEKAANILRQRIREATAKVSSNPVPNSAAAVAEAGAILWEEVVLNQDAYPRDRMEAWFKLGTLAGVIPNANERGGQEKSDTAGTIGALADLVRELRQAVQGQRPAADVINAESTDIRNE